MEPISSPSASGSSPFLQKHSAALRFWHWALFLFISASMICVLFANTILNSGWGTRMVQDQLKEKGVIVNWDQARSVSHEYGDRIWNLHKLIGFGISILLLGRIIIGMTQADEENFRTRIQNALGIYRMNDLRKSDYRHYLIVKFTYLAFFILLFVMACTGLSLAFDDDIATLHSIHRPVKEVHEFCQWLMYTFVFFHLAGVIRAEIGKHRGVVSNMIHGENK